LFTLWLNSAVLGSLVHALPQRDGGHPFHLQRGARGHAHTTPSHIVATFTVHGTTSDVAFASRLANGNTLITDSNNNRIVEVDQNDNPVGSPRRR
jgi:hypothetical protein